MNVSIFDGAEEDLVFFGVEIDEKLFNSAH